MPDFFTGPNGPNGQFNASNPEHINWLRHHVGLTQERFAGYLGVTAKTVSCWEGGHRSPSPLAQRVLHNMFEKFGHDRPGFF